MEVTVSYLLMLQKYFNSKQKPHYALFLGNVSKDLTINNKKNRIKWSCKIFLW